MLYLQAWFDMYSEDLLQLKVFPEVLVSDVFSAYSVVSTHFIDMVTHKLLAWQIDYVY